MAGIRSWTRAYRDDQLPDLVGGHTSILFGRNLRSSCENPSPGTTEEKAERLTWAKRVYRLINRRRNLVKD